MFATPSMVSMEMTAEERAENSPIVQGGSYEGPKYPWGLALRLENDSLEKLKVDFDSLEVGESYHLFALAKVTAKSSNERDSGEPCRCVELQITHLGAESEDAENQEVAKPTHTKMYKK